MEMNERIYYDVNEMTWRIEASLDRMKPYQYDSRYRELLGEHIVDKISVWERNIRQRKNDPFTLVVCGDFKRGKSSLINALLGEDVAVTNVTSETVTLNAISYGAHKNEAVLSGGRRISITDEELSRNSLEKLMKQIGEPVRRLEIHRPIEILKDITIVDTPGLSDSSSDFSDDVEQALQQADAVIYVFSVAYPLSRTEQLYLKTAIIPQKYTSLFLIANFSDMMSNEEDYARMEDMLRERVREFLSGQNIIMVSALDERCRQLDVERPNEVMKQRLEDNFAGLREEIDTLIREKRETVLPDRMQRMLRMMAADINDDLSALEKGLQMDSGDMQRALDALNSEKENQGRMLEENAVNMKRFIRRMQGEASEWMDGLLQRMKQDTSTLDSFSADDLIKYYPLFCVDTLQDAMTRCMERHTEDLLDELEGISDEMSRNMGKDNSETEYNFRFVLNNRAWTKGDNVSFVVSRFDSGLLALAANGIGGLMRKSELKDRKPQVIEAISRQYDSLFVSVQKEITRTYQKLETNAVHVMEDFYNEKLETLKLQLEQSVQAARQDDGKKEEIRRSVGELRGLMREMQQLV